MSSKHAQKQTPTLPREDVPVKVLAVYNYQTEHFEKELVQAINELNERSGHIVVDYVSECVDDVETFIGRPLGDGTRIVLNLVSYFAESYNYDREESVSFMQNVSLLGALLAYSAQAGSMLVNLSLNNPMFLSLNDRNQCDKLEVFMEHKCTALGLLRSQDVVKWVNIETGYIESPSDKIIFNQFGKEFFVNSSVYVNPIPKQTLIEQVISFILRAGDRKYNESVRVMGHKTSTMYQYFKSIAPTALVHEYVDFVEEIPNYSRYVKRFVATRSITEI